MSHGIHVQKATLGTTHSMGGNAVGFNKLTNGLYKQKDYSRS